MNDGSNSMKGKTCIITGATSGIGRAAAEALSPAGANLILIGRRESVGMGLAKRLAKRRGAGRMEFLRADISDQRQVRALAEAIAGGVSALRRAATQKPFMQGKSWFIPAVEDDGGVKR